MCSSYVCCCYCCGWYFVLCALCCLQEVVAARDKAAAKELADCRASRCQALRKVRVVIVVVLVVVVVLCACCGVGRRSTWGVGLVGRVSILCLSSQSQVLEDPASRSKEQRPLGVSLCTKSQEGCFSPRCKCSFCLFVEPGTAWVLSSSLANLKTGGHCRAVLISKRNTAVGRARLVLTAGPCLLLAALPACTPSCSRWLLDGYIL